MIGVVYSSKAGNTELLANSLSLLDCAYTKKVSEVDALACVDVLCVGFWVLCGDADMETRKFLSTLKNQKLFLFGTSGHRRDEEYGKIVLENIKTYIDSSNEILGFYMCQGKMNLADRERFKNDPEKLHDFEASLSHPNNEDISDLLKSINEIL